MNSFLRDMANGVYTSTNGDGSALSLSASSATPDQQSFSTLASGIVSLATEFDVKAPTSNVMPAAR